MNSTGKTGQVASGSGEFPAPHATGPHHSPSGRQTTNGAPEVPEALLATNVTAGNGKFTAPPIPGHDNIPKNAIVHGTCRRWWTGNDRSHCGGSAVFAFPLRDCDALLTPKPDAGSLEGAPDGCGVEPHLAGDLVGTQTRSVQTASLRSIDQAVAASMLVGSDWHEIQWAVVGLDVVRVVDVLAIPSDGASNNPVFVCLDVLVGTNLPSKADVPVGGQVPLRLSLGERLIGRDVPDLAFLRLLTRRPAIVTSPSLAGCVGDRSAAVHADDGEFPHKPMVVAIASCHRTFSSLTAFDRHRRNGQCLPPAEVGLVARQKPYGALWAFPAPEGGYAFHTDTTEAVQA